MTIELCKYVGSVMQDAQPPVTFDENGSSGNIYAGLLPQTDGLALSVIPTGGFTNNFNTRVDAPTYQILVKGASGDAVTPENVAYLAYENLQDIYNVETNDGSKIISCECTSPPRFLKTDSNGCYIYTFNIVLKILNNKWRQ
jgi:hypothetical protein